MSLCLPPLLLIAVILSSAAITAGVAQSEGASTPDSSASFLYRSHRHQLQSLSPDRGALSTPAWLVGGSGSGGGGSVAGGELRYSPYGGPCEGWRGLRALRGGIDWMKSESESAVEPESPRGLAGVFGSAPPPSISLCMSCSAFWLGRPGGNPGANHKSISHRCHPILVAFVWVLTKETIHLSLGCLQGGSCSAFWLDAFAKTGGAPAP